MNKPASKKDPAAAKPASGPNVKLINQQELLELDHTRLKTALRGILAEAGIQRGRVNLVVVDDPTIHRLNRQFLEHDYPTDVLSFLMEQAPGRIEGEVIVSAETAQRSAAEYGWQPGDELLLYAIHGTLHLVGFDDTTDEALAEMRAAEGKHLRAAGLEPRY